MSKRLALRRVTTATHRRLAVLGERSSLPGGLTEALVDFDRDVQGLRSAMETALENVDREPVCRAIAIKALKPTFRLWEMRLNAPELLRLALACFEVGERFGTVIEAGELQDLAGVAALRAGDLQRAIKLGCSAADMLATADAKEPAARAEMNLANALMKAGRPQQAINRLEAVIGRAEVDSADKLDGRVWQSLALAKLAIGDLVQAEDYAMRARDWASRVGDRLEYSNSLGTLGVIARRSENYDTAAARQTERLEVARELGHRRGERNALSQLGSIADDQNDSEEALLRHYEVLALSRVMGDEHGEMYDLINLGCAHLNNAEPEIAIPLLEQARRQALSLGDRLRAAIADENAMHAYFQVGRAGDAINAAERATKVYEQVDEKRLQRLRESLTDRREQLVEQGKQIG